MRLFHKRPREEGGLGDHLMVASIRSLAKLPWGVALGVGEGVGRLLSVFRFAKPYRIARTNIALCFPELPSDQQELLARRSLINLGRNVIAGAVSWIRDVPEMSSKITVIENEELLHQAVTSGRGVIFFSPHMGCWEFINFYLCSRYPLIILAKPFGGPKLNEVIERGRSRLLGKLAPTNEKGVRALLSSLKAGGMTYLTPDHVPQASSGIYAPFFGLSTTTGVLTSRLLQKTGATALAVTCAIQRDNTFRLRFIEVDKEMFDKDINTAVAALNRTLEKCIRSAPEQYQWSYRRFKKIEGRRSPY